MTKVHLKIVFASNFMNIIKKSTIIILIGILFIPFGYIIYAYTISYKILKEYKVYSVPLPTRIYDSKNRLIGEIYDQYRKYIKISQIPHPVKDAFLATEDRAFYLHRGFDLRGILRAIMRDISAGSFAQGGSTISQQLVKQLYTNNEKSLRRKLIELFITKELEEKFTKDKILEMYLNHIYFGHGVYGVAAASEFFFSKDISRLNIVEAAVLAGISSSPNKYSPLKNPINSYKKTEKILFNLIVQNKIEKSQTAQAFQTFWKNFTEKSKTSFPDRHISDNSKNRVPWFTEYIRRILIKNFGEEKVYRGGLTVKTSLNLDYQRAGKKLLEETLARQDKIAGRVNRWKISKLEMRLYRQSLKKEKPKESLSGRNIKLRFKTMKYLMREFGDSLSLVSQISGCHGVAKSFEDSEQFMDRQKRSTGVQGALVALEPKTGNIITMVGGSTFSSKNQLNRVVQTRRQPGSAFKIFIYGAAVEDKKISPATSFDDLPITYKGRRKSWNPSNYSKKFTGKVLVRRALAQSLNVVPARIYDIMGGGKLARFASKLTGVPLKRFEIDPTLSLGSTELSPLELTKGIAVYANSGIEVKPRSILAIRDRKGKIIYKAKAAGKKRVVSKATSFIMTDLLREVVKTGTASHAVRRVGGFRLPCAGKTGTNTKFRDAWFTGYTPKVVTTVWVGCDSPEFSLGSGQSGSAVAAPLWGKYMAEVHRKGGAVPFPKRPDSVIKREICKVTGNLADKGCRRRNEFFIKGTEPQEKCEGLHGQLSNIKELIKINKTKNKETEEENSLFKSWEQESYKEESSEKNKEEIDEYNFSN